MAPLNIPAKLEHFIGGTHTPSADGATFEVADPVSNRPYATVAAGGPDDVDHAVTAAARVMRAQAQAQAESAPKAQAQSPVSSAPMQDPAPAQTQTETQTHTQSPAQTQPAPDHQSRAQKPALEASEELSKLDRQAWLLGAALMAGDQALRAAQARRRSECASGDQADQ